MNKNYKQKRFYLFYLIIFCTSARNCFNDSFLSKFFGGCKSPDFVYPNSKKWQRNEVSRVSFNQLDESHIKNLIPI